MTGFATITSKNQLTLPVDLVQLLAWTAGTGLWVKEENRKVVLERIPTIEEIREEVQKNPKVRKLNAKYSTVEIVRLARQIKPPKNIYEY